MSVQKFGSTRLSNIASNLYRDHAEFLFTYQERQVARQKADHEAKLFSKKENPRDDLTILLDNYRWFFERIHLANQLQYIKRYTKYEEQGTVKQECIDVLAQTATLPITELLTELKLIHYNTDEFLNQEDEQQLLRYIGIVTDRVIQLSEIKAR